MLRIFQLLALTEKLTYVHLLSFFELFFRHLSLVTEVLSSVSYII
jgi:hypothetical protein